MLINAEIAGRIIRLKVPFYMKGRCMAIPGGVWSKAGGTWDYLLTPATATAIFSLFNGELPPEIYSRLDCIRRTFTEAVKIKELPIDQLPDIPIAKTRPWDHQKRAYWFITKLLGLDETRA